MAGAVSRGYWTRLYARAFYFEGTDGQRLAIVSCDLVAIPDALDARVSYLINTQWARLACFGDAHCRPTPVAISPDQLIIAATHTHQGPGNFWGARAYNSFTSPNYGFSEELFSFLADRIATAVVLAAQDAYKASTATVSLAVYHRADSFCHPYGFQKPCRLRRQLTRNRAPFPFMLNPDRDTVTQELNAAATCGGPLCPDSLGVPGPFRQGVRGCEPAYGWDDTERCPRLEAVDPRLTLLAVNRDRGTGPVLIGLLVFFAAHPTVLLPTSPINSSDFSGTAVTTLESELPNNPVIAFFNGAEGDVHMRRLRRDFRDVLRWGGELSDNVRELLQTKPVVDNRPVDVSITSLDARNFGSRAVKSICKPDWDASGLARIPTYGVAGLGGGEGDRTIMYDLGWREGIRGQPANGQASKWPALDSTMVRELRLTWALAPPKDFPQRLPVTYAKLGPLTLATVPGEPSITMGYRIRNRLMPDEDCQSTSSPFKCLVLVGLSNAYVSYIATPEEYEAQEYVGASTLWGPQEGPVLGCGLISLRESLREHARPPRVCIPEQRFQPGAPPNKPFGVGFCGDRRQDPGEDLGDILLDDHGRPARLLPWFQWKETARGCRAHTLLGPTRNEFCDDFDAQSHRRVFIEEINPSDGQWRPRQVSRTCVIEQPVTDGGKSVNDDDQGCNFVTTLMNGVSPPNRHWGSIWAAKVLEDPPPHGRFRFRVEFPGAQPKRADECSEGFDLAAQTREVSRDLRGCPDR